MGRLTEEQEDFLIAELKDLDILANSLKREIGNETCLEFHERMKEIRIKLNLDDWK